MLWYEKEANCFEEALPIGNGHYGAMVYGGVKKEKLALNHDCFWSGVPYDEKYDAVNEAFLKTRQLMDEGKMLEAQETLDKYLVNGISATFLSAANLFLDFGFEGETSDYKRVLNLENAISTTVYKTCGKEIKREIFASNPDKLIAMKIESSEKISVELTSNSHHPMTVQKNKDSYEFEIQAPSFMVAKGDKTDTPCTYDDKDNNRSILLFGKVYFQTDGEIVVKNDKFIIINFTKTNLYIKLSSSFVDFQSKPLQYKDERIESELSFDKLMNYELIKERHIADYQDLYNKSSLQIKSDKFDDVPTDKRIIRQMKNHDDNGLVVLLWDYGKYLTIASSRKNSKPTNLQGIWSEEYRPHWSSAFTMNINTEMNYWHCGVANLSDCHLPLFDYMNDLAVNGAKTASEYYNCQGWCSHHKSDIWACTKPNGARAIHAFWPMSGVWLCSHIWEHYLFNLDKDFLEKQLHLIQGSTRFIMDWLVEGEDGKLHAYPSSSPENSYNVEGERVSVNYDTAMDIALIKNLFDICIKAENVLKIDELSTVLEQAMTKLPNYKIGSQGQLLEWGEELLETDITHRHISHLFGLYPANSIKYSDKQLVDACNKTLEIRGNMTTGWGIAWRINVWARLKNAQMALDTIHNLLRLKIANNPVGDGGGIYANLFDAHPPFQIDGNFGYVAGVCEMLLQTQEDVIDILPALPKEWGDGEFKGFVARGSHVVDCKWNENVVVCKIKFANDGEYKISYLNNMKTYSVCKNEIVAISFYR